ncbi:DUF4270 domain-containing protein [Parabacteroides sp. FAFU027]|uniref:DUF4270 domain-containing protein n=1 Tax=Parabacteroides sp. FAFU027 TaxID=2922715 RepID=UPI001FAECBF0|nr:DUF4270 domain-containing protein [Parabacteroides sp. FAFU027]
MKLKYLFLALASYALFSCNDTLDQIGSILQPNSDILAVSNDTFNIESATVILDSIYAKTDIGLLGKFHDDTYGNLTCDYFGQVRCPDDFSLTTKGEELLSLDSASIALQYTSYVGDSLEPMQISVYRMKNTDAFSNGKNLYSNHNTPKSSDLTFWRKKTVSTYDASIPDSLRSTSSTRYLYMTLPAGSIDTLVKKAKNPTEFNKYIPGLYFTTNYGTKAIIKTTGSFILLHYTYKKDTDTISNQSYPLAFTKELFQINHYQNNTNWQELDTINYSYIKTPVGLVTKLPIPLGQMADSLIKHNAERLNGVKLALGSVRVEKLTSVLQPPTYLLLVKKTQMDSLFSGKITFDAEKHLYATFSKTNNTYTFSNLRTALNDDLNALANQIKAAKEEGNATKLSSLINQKQEFYLVPFTIQNSNTSGTITAISHDFAPSAVKLKTKDLKMSIIYSK